MVGILTERSAGGSHPAVKWCAPQLRLQFAQASKKKQMRHDKLWCMQVEFIKSWPEQGRQRSFDLFSVRKKSLDFTPQKWMQMANNIQAWIIEIA
jgi:hypothetical protein